LKPNIILLTVDCWRGDHLGLASDSVVQTPNIDRFAQQSTRYDNAYTSGGWTKIAMTSLFSSTYPSMYGFCQGKLSDERPSLAETLKQHGYQTAGFTTNLVCGSAQGFARGFDHFEDLKSDSKTNKFNIRNIRGFDRLARSPISRFILSSLGADTSPRYPSTTARELVEHSLHWLGQRDSEQPCFMWLHFMDLHMPYRSSLRAKTASETKQMWQDREEFIGVRKSRGVRRVNQNRQQRWQQLYAQETKYLDGALGYFFDELKKQQNWQQTAICLTADHGEEFYEHGSWGHSWNQLHKEGTRVPLMIKSPQQSQASQEKAFTSHIDIAPTLLDFANAPVPEKMIGSSLNQSKKSGNENVLYTEMLGHAKSYRYRLSIIKWPYKYLYDGDNDKCLLFDLSKDPEEQKNLYRKSCSISKDFDRLRLKHISKGALEALKGNLELSEDTLYYDLDDDPLVIERLRALGYMD